VSVWAARVVCLLFALIGALPLGVTLLARTERVKRWAAEEASRLLRQELGIEAAFQTSVQPWPLTVRIHHLVVDSSNGTGPAIEADEVALRPRIFSLIQGRLNAGDIEIERPRIRLDVRDGRILNLDVRQRQRPPASPEPSAASPFSSLAIDDATFDLSIDGTRIGGTHVDADVTAEQGSAFDVALRLSSLTIDRTSVLEFDGPGAPAAGDATHEDVICSLDARLRVDGSTVLVRRLRMKGGADSDPAVDTRPGCNLPEDDVRRVELELRNASVSVDDQGLRAVSGHAQVRAPLRVANRFVRFLPLSGWIGADVEGIWERGRALPDVRGRVSGDDISMGIYSLARDLSADVRIEAGVVRAPHVELGFADGHVAIDDVEVKPLEKGIPISADVLTLEHLQFPGLMRDLGVTDHTHVRMHFRDGTLRAIRGTADPLHIDSDMLAHVSDFEVFDGAFDDPLRKHVLGVRQATVRSRFAVRPGAVEFQGSRVEFGSSRINVFTSLGFHNEFRLDVSKESHIDLADISPIVDIPWKGLADLNVQITGVFNEPDIRADLSIRRFEFADMQLGDLQSAKVEFRPLVLQIGDARGMKGRSPYLVPSMRVDFTGPAPVVADAAIESSDFDVRDFLSIFGFETDPRFAGIFGAASARATLRYELGGDRDQCGGGWLGVRAQAHLRRLELFDEKYDDGDVDLDYEWVDRDAQEQGVRVDLRSFVVRKGGGTIVGSGAIQPGGFLRVRAVASQIPLASVQALGSLGPMLDATVSATADIHGTLDRIDADIDARMSSLRMGTAVLPPSAVQVRLVSTDPPARQVGRTRCGHSISAPFDPAEFRRDIPQGIFVANGELFGGQIRLEDVQVTRQQHKQVTGRIAVRGLDLGKIAGLIPALSRSDSPIEGRLGGVLDIRHLELDAPATADVSLVLDELDLRRAEGSVHLREGTPAITLRADELEVPAVLLDFETPGGLTGAFLTTGKVHHVSTRPELDLSAHLLPTDLSAIADLLPRVERARGVVRANLELRGPATAPSYKGEVDLDDGALSIRGFPVPIDDINVRVMVSERELKLERASARVGAGEVRATGTLPVKGFDFGTATAALTARNIHVPVIDGVNMTMDADLTASWSARIDEAERNIPRVVGDVTLTSFEYTRPVTIDADISSLAQRGKRTHFELYDPAEDLVDFEIRLHAAQPLRFRNNLADMQLVLDSPSLTLSGSNQRAGLRGALRVKPGGRVRLRRNEFEVRDGLIRFDDVTRIAPSIDVTAVTEYRRYSQSQSRTASTSAGAGGGAGASGSGGAAGVSGAGGQWRIQLHAHGDSDNLRLDLSSEPALSQEDIVLLLTLGMTRAEMDQMQAANLGESAALEALSTVTGADDAVRETIPVIDDFRLGSAYSSRSGRTEPTVTVGKRVTERVRANVTSGLSESREVRSNLEWELTGTTSVLGSYDNVNNVSNSSLGNLGTDIRFRINFE